MTIYFSIKNDGFYNTDAGIEIPEDAIKITEKQYHTFLNAMNNENKMLVLENNKLVLKPRPSELTWDMIRNKRNRLLTQSDFTQTFDFPESKRKIWSDYRQKLRDITKEFANPWEVIWPKQPN